MDADETGPEPSKRSATDVVRSNSGVRDAPEAAGMSYEPDDGPISDEVVDRLRATVDQHIPGGRSIFPTRVTRRDG